MPADILCVIAHPDDELLCAGVLAHHARQGRSIVLAVVTTGAGGPPAWSPKMRPGRIAKLRQMEMLASAKVLGAWRVEFLGYRDSYHKPLARDPSEVTRRIRKLIEQFQPAIVLTHGPDGEYGHPNHIGVSRAATEAIDSIPGRNRPLLYYCNAYLAEAPLPRSNVSVKANYVFPVTGRNFETRHKVMCCHVTQAHCFLGYFGRDHDRECFHRVGKPNRHSAWFEVVPD